jgi:Tol biopolymer transport system component
MSDLKVALQELKEDSESGRLMTSVGPAPAARRRPAWPIMAAALVAIAAVAVWFMLGRSSETAPAYEVTPLTTDTGLTSMPAISPDGKLVVYASDRASRRPNLWLQQVEGGQAVQLTHHEEGAGAPAFSPDSSRIAYAGFGEKDQGVFVIPAIGGEPRKLAAEGVFPKFSPDGSRLAYWVRDGFHGRLRVIAVTGGEPTRIAPEFDGAAPLWSHDGSRLLAVGRVDIKAPRRDAFDWFTIALHDGSVVRTGAAAALRAQNVLPESIDIIPSPEGWSGQSVLFTVRTDGAANVWRVTLNPSTFQVEGSAEQLTFGTAQSIMPSMSLDGKMAFVASDFIGDYWQLPIDANAETVAGPRTQLMKSSSSDGHALSLDGATLFFCSHRSGQSEIRSRDLRTGKETSLVTSPNLHHVGAVTADGTTFMYSVPGRTPGRFLATTTGGAPRKICEQCTHFALSKDASKLLHIVEPDHQTYRLLDIASGASTELMKGGKHQFYAATFSPDGRWTAVITTTGHLFLVPVRDSLVDEKEWITVGKLSQGQYEWPRFSPDGAAIYYGSPQDGNMCIYAQRLSASGQPEGEPVAIEHLHEPSAVGHPHSLEVGADKIVLSLNRGSSNIWLRQPRK